MPVGNVCAYCGNTHKGVCPRVASFEYHADGKVKAVTFHPPVRTKPEPESFSDIITAFFHGPKKRGE